MLRLFLATAVILLSAFTEAAYCEMKCGPQKNCDVVVAPSRICQPPVPPARICTTVVAPERICAMPVAPERRCTRWVQEPCSNPITCKAKRTVRRP